MNPDYTNLSEALMAAKFRASCAINARQREEFQNEINHLEAEIAVIDLMEEVSLRDSRKPIEVLTDDIATVSKLFSLHHKREIRIIELDKHWSWRPMGWLYYIKYKEL